MSRTGTRLLAVAIGVVAGLAVLIVFASRLGMSGDAGLGGGPVASTASPTSLPSPTAVASAKQVSSLSALAIGQGLRSGDLVEVRVSAATLNQDLARYLEGSAEGVSVSNTKITLRPGQVILTGTASQGVLATSFTITSHPDIQNGQLVLVVDSVQPALVGQFSSVKPGQAIPIAPNLDAKSVTVTDSAMVVVGTVK